MEALERLTAPVAISEIITFCFVYREVSRVLFFVFFSLSHVTSVKRNINKAAALFLVLLLIPFYWPRFLLIHPFMRHENSPDRNVGHITSWREKPANVVFVSFLFFFFLFTTRSCSVCKKNKINKISQMWVFSSWLDVCCCCLPSQSFI